LGRCRGFSRINSGNAIDQTLVPGDGAEYCLHGLHKPGRAVLNPSWVVALFPLGIGEVGFNFFFLYSGQLRLDDIGIALLCRIGLRSEI
jgi:hypothetical protein